MNNQKKKILLIITKSNFGGAQKYVYELAKNLKKRDQNVSVVLGGNGILIDKLKAADIPTFTISFLERDFSIINDFKVFIKLYTSFRKHKPDVVHLNSSKIGGIGSVAAWLASVPKTIFTVHGWAFNEDRSVLSKFVFKWLYSIILIFSDNVIAVSSVTRDQAHTLPFHFLFSHKIEVINNGIEVPEFMSKESAREFLSQKINTELKDKIIIGQIAELHPIKSIETTIDTATHITSKISNSVFIIIGDGQDKELLQKQIIEKGLQDKVFLAGFIDNAATYLKAFDIFCLTSKSEALALVLMEAGLAQVPVVASRVGGIPELITNGETGFLFKSGDVQELTEKIEHALALTTEEKRKITDKYYEKIQKGFLADTMTEKTLALY